MPVPMIAIFAMCPSSGSALVRASDLGRSNGARKRLVIRRSDSFVQAVLPDLDAGVRCR
jgi:hypothetical protein